MPASSCDGYTRNFKWPEALERAASFEFRGNSKSSPAQSLFDGLGREAEPKWLKPLFGPQSNCINTFDRLGTKGDGKEVGVRLTDGVIRENLSINVQLDGKPLDDGGLANLRERLLDKGKWKHRPAVPGGDRHVQLLKVLPQDMEVGRMRWSPDGSRLAVPARDGAVRIYRTTDWQKESTLDGGHSGKAVLCVAWNPTGEELATGGRDGTIQLWDFRRGPDRRTRKKIDDHGRHTNEINDLTWLRKSPDTREYNLVSASDDGNVYVWDPDGRNVTEHLPHEGTPKILGLAASRSGSHLATAALDGRIRIWSTRPWRRLEECGHGSGAVSIRFHPEREDLLASCSQDDRSFVQLWQIDGNRVFRRSTLLGHSQNERRLEGHRRTVTSIAFSPDGRYLASKSHDDTIKLWHVRTGKLITTLEEPSARLYSPQIDFHPHENCLATLGDKDQTVRIWKVSPKLSTKWMDDDSVDG